jgi:cell fate regulator YaaT (PSP1 superfamily)
MDYIVRDMHTRETDLCEVGSLDVGSNDIVVYDGRYGLDLGILLGPAPEDKKKRYKDRFNAVRVATEEDIDRYQVHDRRADDAARTCASRVEAHKLDMRVVSAHYILDGSKLLFFFVSDQRVDFRTLVRDLVGLFQVRVELRQIGVRDETRITGGMGVCGRRLCCNGVSDRLPPVSIRMAKDQNYSLNSMKVSGPCGRLLCCLSYEHQFYQEERRRYPREGALVEFEDSTCKVQEINILTGHVRISGPDGQKATLPLCALQRRTGKGGDKSRRPVEWKVNEENCPVLAMAAAHTADDIV